MRRFSVVKSVAFAFFYPGVSHAALEALVNAEPPVVLGMLANAESLVVLRMLENAEQFVALGMLAIAEPPVDSGFVCEPAMDVVPCAGL